MKTLNVGLIGYGFMGRMHSFCYKTIPMIYRNAPRVRIVGVSTAHEETARAAAAEIGCDFATADWRRLIDRDDVDIIDVCSPNASHKDQVIAALRAGKHVYCDKPLTTSSADAREIVAAARQAKGCIHQMTFQNRFFPATLRAKELISEGRLGRIYHFRAAYLHAGYVDPGRPFTWRMDKAQGGGALVDLGSHVLDLMRHLLGEFESVCAATETFVKQRPLPGQPGRTHAVEVDDWAMLTVKMAAGFPGTIESSRFAMGVNDELRFEIHGEKGALRFNLMEPNWLYFFDNTDPGGNYGGTKGFKQIECVQRYPDVLLPTPKNSIGWRDAHRHCLCNFVKCVAEGRPASPDLADGAAVQHIIDAAYRSAEAGGWVKVDDVGMSDE